VDRAELASVCRRNGVRKLAILGSVLTPRFSDEGDVGVLVEFQPGERVGYLRMAELARELSPLFGGRRVDLRTPMELDRYFRDEVLRIALHQYEARDIVLLPHTLDAAREAATQVRVLSLYPPGLT